MTDDELTRTWMTFTPTTDARRRMQMRLFAYVEAHDTSIAAEWLALLRMSPFATLGLTTVSAVAVAVPLLMWVVPAAGLTLR